MANSERNISEAGAFAPAHPVIMRRNPFATSYWLFSIALSFTMALSMAKSAIPETR